MQEESGLPAVERQLVSESVSEAPSVSHLLKPSEACKSLHLLSLKEMTVFKVRLENTPVIKNKDTHFY